MCGINGITKEDRTRIDEMNVRTHHRGPDGTQVWVGDGISFGHNRLSIIDLSTASDQPMLSGSGRYRIVFNGEIYNYRELREILRPHYEFRTEGDTEVLLAAYSVWDVGMFARLRGMFAFGLWDNEKRELLLARDQMGIKPLYYRVEEKVLSFSSEIPALLSSSTSSELSLTALAHYLTMEYVPGSETLIQGIHKLEPGQYLLYKEGEISITTYDTAPLNSTLPVVTHADIYSTIDAAVHAQMVSDRPIGAYLSGGFDSSIVVHHMTKYSTQTKTYSVGFEAVKGEESDTTKFNIDADLAEETARRFGTQHTRLTVTPHDIRNHLETAIQKMSEPVANATALSQYLLSDFVRKDGVVVVLGGDGGDELFGGYTRHRMLMAAYQYQRLPQILQSFGARMVPRAKKLRLPFGTPLHRALMVKDEKKIHPFLKKQIPMNQVTTDFFEARYENTVSGVTPLDTFMRVDRATWLPEECFVRADYASMAHGVEQRVPLVDIDLRALADRIPIHQKVTPFMGKRILRDTYRTYLPEYLYREPKRGWISPAAKWFRDEGIGAILEEVCSSKYYDGLDTIIDWESVQRYMKAHKEKKGYYLYPLWNIVVLQIWARAHKVTAT